MNQYDLKALLNDFYVAQKGYPFILLDFPFGYRHQDLTTYIDHVVYIKTPLDIALARGVIRDYRDRSTEEIMHWLTQYLDGARTTFMDYETFISETADLILDGTMEVMQQTALVLESISAIEE